MDEKTFGFEFEPTKRTDPKFKEWFEQYFGFPLLSEKGAGELVITADALEKCWNSAIESLPVDQAKKKTESPRR
jgi:hypothetical protein